MTIKRNETHENAQYLGELKVLQKLSEYEFGVELWVMRDGVNRNLWDYRKVEDYYKTFAGTPILCAYVLDQVGDGHNMREKVNPQTGERYYSFTDGTAERIVGTLSDDINDLSLVQRDGYTWIVAKGRLFSFYAPELVEKIVQTGRMDVSAETEVTESHTEDDIEVFTKWAGLGVTILGDKVDPAIPGAHIAALAAMQDEFKELKLRAASLSEKAKEETKPREKEKITKGVKKHMNKQAIARLSGKFEGYHIVGLSEDGMRVALVDDKGAAYTYTFNAEDKGEVLTAKIVPANVSVCFSFSEDEGVYADMADIVDVAVNTATNNGETATLREQLDAANATITKLQAAEHERRIQSVKDIITRTLEEICVDGEDAELSAEAESLCNNAEQYAAIEKNGAFCGDAEARACLMSKYAEKCVAKAKADKKARENNFAWDNFNKGKTTSGNSIEDMLSFING